MTDTERLRAAIMIETLESAHAAARANMRRAWDELDDNDLARHWSGVAGWLRTRIKKLQQTGEPDRDDAMVVDFGAGIER